MDKTSSDKVQDKLERRPLYNACNFQSGKDHG